VNRREFAQRVAGVSVAASLAAAGRSVKKYGALDVEGHLAHRRTTGEYLRVTVDGIDVTESCHYANDVEGVALIYCRDPVAHWQWDAKGAVHVNRDSGGACVLRLQGHVVIQPGPPR
jgi:hypothetical protein